jgi:hypothetical protein
LNFLWNQCVPFSSVLIIAASIAVSEFFKACPGGFRLLLLKNKIARKHTFCQILFAIG